ncbi:hypothetical protein EVAR_87739_1 [Eumeta japonica]|uniref:Uncharacterized protein n=1 Tax=Eumeta variegata TaxID=151549 RepID=A0A4C1ZQN9_EUMVA|nr:hypothetical protein EVAR_87739_1 [Eumeta japonica]
MYNFKQNNSTLIFLKTPPESPSPEPQFYVLPEPPGPPLRGPRDLVVLSFFKISPDWATGKFGEFAQMQFPLARIERTNKNLVSLISFARQIPKCKSGLTSKWFFRCFSATRTCRGQPDTAISSFSRDADFRNIQEVVRPRELGPHGHVVLIFFPDFSRTGHEKNPEVSRQTPLRKAL